MQKTLVTAKALNQEKKNNLIHPTLKKDKNILYTPYLLILSQNRKEHRGGLLARKKKEIIALAKSIM